MRSGSALAVLTALFVAACSSGAGSTAPATTQASTPPASAAPASGSTETVDLTVFAAASLSNVLDEIKPAYETAHPGTTLTISSDSSAALEMQIEQGAPADVFLSADTTNPKKLVDRGMSSGEAIVFAANKLTIVVPADDPAKVTSPRDLAKSGLRIIAAGDAVPITKYATELVANLAKVAGYPADFATAYAANIVSKEDNVKAVMGKIELGEGDAAIVYVTDAAASTKVRTIDIPVEANVPASYAGVVVGASAHQEAARTFLGWLTSADAQAILQRAGFLPPAG